MSMNAQGTDLEAVVDNTNSLINQTLHTELLQTQSQKLAENARNAMIRVESVKNTNHVMEDLMVGIGEGGVPQLSPEEETANLASQLDALISSSKINASEKGILTLWRQALSATDNQGGDVIRDRVRKYVAKNKLEPITPPVRAGKSEATPLPIDPNERVNAKYKRGDI